MSKHFPYAYQSIRESLKFLFKSLLYIKSNKRLIRLDMT